MAPNIGILLRKQVCKDTDVTHDKTAKDVDERIYVPDPKEHKEFIDGLFSVLIVEK